MNIAIIPARAGSQRIPKKNIKQFCGKPMIEYALEAAESSNHIKKIIVSTDSKEITKIALEHGALVPFKRPEELSDHLTPTVPVIAHAVKTLIELGWEIENVCCIYPCTPLLQYKRLDQIFNKMINGKHQFAYPVVSYNHPIQRAMEMTSGGKMKFFFPQHELARTQDLEPAYHDTGQFYWGTLDAWLKEKKMHTDGIGVKVNLWEFVDIDTEEDWEQAELLRKVVSQQLIE